MTESEATRAEGPESCAGCAAGSGRRAFLRDAGGLVVAIVLTAGARPAEAATMVLRATRAIARSGGEASYPIPETDGAVIDRENEIILMRNEGRIYAFALSCPHRRTMLKWREKNGQFQCPKHKSKYRPDGTFISGRATRGMDRYAVRIEAGQVIVDTTTRYRQDEDEAGWNAAFASL